MESLLINQLPKEKAQILQAIIGDFRLQLVVMFGSQASGKTHRESDTDIAVKSFNHLTPSRRLELAHQFEKVYPNVDVCDLRSASPLLLALVEKEGKLVFEEKALVFEEFKIFARNNYIESRPYYDDLERRNIERLAKLKQDSSS